MINLDDNESSDSELWQKHRIEQMLQFRSLPLRQKMQAIEELDVIARRLKKIKSGDGQFEAPPDDEL